MGIESNKKNIITICMGSSCFSRGNNQNVAIIEKFILDEQLDSSVEMVGCLCKGDCRSGPNIMFDDELIQGVQPSMLLDLLKHKIGGKA